MIYINHIISYYIIEGKLNINNLIIDKIKL